MNRAERRKQKITEKPVVLSIKQEDLQKMLEESFEKGRKSANHDEFIDVFVMLLAIPCKVLMEEYGWGVKKRLPDFADKIIKEYEQFDESPMSIQEWREWVYQNTGIRFQ